jgi:hypothetical protein
MTSKKSDMYTASGVEHEAVKLEAKHTSVQTCAASPRTVHANGYEETIEVKRKEEPVMLLKMYYCPNCWRSPAVREHHYSKLLHRITFRRQTDTIQQI